MNVKEENRRVQNNRVVFIHADSKDDYSQQTNELTDKRRSNSLSLRKIITFGLLVFFLLVTSVQYWQARQDESLMKEELAMNRSLNSELRLSYEQAYETLQYMKDPDYLAEVARRDYFYSKPGEIIFDVQGNE